MLRLSFWRKLAKKEYKRGQEAVNREVVFVLAMLQIFDQTYAQSLNAAFNLMPSIHIKRSLFSTIANHHHYPHHYDYEGHCVFCCCCCMTGGHKVREPASRAHR